jgi:hypothetical protein
MKRRAKDRVSYTVREGGLHGLGMRAAIGLIGLSLLGGVAPTGLSGLPYAAPVLAGTAGALVLLVAGCLAGASLAARRGRPAASVASRIPLGRVASARAASRIISRASLSRPDRVGRGKTERISIASGAAIAPTLSLPAGAYRAMLGAEQ